MRVDNIACGPAANESERKALSHLKQQLISIAGDDQWILLTNLAFSVTHQHQSDEIDIIAIGPPGVRVIEVKHWDAQWVAANNSIVESEANKITNKARKIATTLRKELANLGWVGASILITKSAAKTKGLAGKPVLGVGLHPLADWKAAINFDAPTILSRSDVHRLANALDPRSAVALDGSLRRLASFANLELKTPKDERFHRVYRGIHQPSQDAIILHLYDLSAAEESNAEARASRESETIIRIQQYPWAPRIRDTFQSAPGYEGEMYFCAFVDPSAPPISTRASDTSWDTIARLHLARNALRALDEFHRIQTQEGNLVHRNITPDTILVKHDNTPTLIGFERTKIPTEISVAAPPVPTQKWHSIMAPEVRTNGLAAADQRSDIYSLCASLTQLFNDRQDQISTHAAQILDQGRSDEPETRASLPDLASSLAQLLGESVPSPAVPPARFWAEDQEVTFGKHTYRIVSHLGSGGVGTAFKVEKIDRQTNEDLGTYVAKVGHEAETGQRVLKAYNMAHPHLGGHPALSTIYEVADAWRENEFIALMSWIEGSPLRDYMSVLPLLAADFGDDSDELTLRWLRAICEALGVLHRNGLVHGDVSPGNMLVSNRDLVLTDFDFVTRIDRRYTAPGTVLYCSPNRQNTGQALPADDIYALAASFFHVLYDRQPFQYGGVRDKKKGLNWQDLDRDDDSTLTKFLNHATDPDPNLRFKTVDDALDALKLDHRGDTTVEVIDDKPDNTGATTAQTQERQPNEIDWLRSLLQSYPGSRWGNRETRGLDTDFASQTYVETKVEEALLRDIQTRSARLVILCGNAGDGKTALLQHLALSLGLGRQDSSQRILEGKIKDGPLVRMNLDGSAAWQGRSADDLLDQFLQPFLDGPPTKDVVHLLAINDGRLLEWLEKSEETTLSAELLVCLSGEPANPASHIRFIDLNRRSLVGGISPERNRIETDFLERLLDQLYGGENARQIWAPCLTCSAQESCEVFRANKVFGPPEIGAGGQPDIRAHARRRLFNALQAVHLRGETHITVRELRAALVYILFGVHFCRDYHEGRPSPPYWQRAFSPESTGRQGEVLRELVRLDPALDAHPHIDRQLLRANAEIELEPARRRAYFERTQESLGEFTDALDLAQGRYLRLFQRLPLSLNHKEETDLCARLCRGISRLEDLPLQAFARTDVVPLRITPRTPTETAFWVEKPISAFRLEVDLSTATEGLEQLHRDAFLIYHRRDGSDERLRMGVDLFHLLLELSDGYQMGDVSSDDTFAHLSIFVQRLVQEDDREIFAWNPMNDESVYRIAAEKLTTDKGLRQKLVARPIATGTTQ
ncbi:protein kinase [Candidatus Saccharibacteria bacterium]|nr:protein kinase [Candidatus Saccharibacteria bacterium]